MATTPGQRSTISADLRVHGRLSSGAVSLPGDGVRACPVMAPQADNSDPWSASKRRHMQRPSITWPGTLSGSRSQTAHICKAAGEVIALDVTLLTQPAGDRTVTIDLSVADSDGALTSILVQPVVLDSDHQACEVCHAAIYAGDVVAGSKLVITATAAGSSGTQPADLCVNLTIHEKP